MKTEGDMMDEMMGPCEPAELFSRIVECSQAEVALYGELAAGAPGTCLGQKISTIAASKACEEPVLAAVAAAFGVAHQEPPLTPPFPPTSPVFDPPSTPGPLRGQNYHHWLKKTAHALKMNLSQVRRLSHLAAMAPDEVTRQLILDLTGRELQDATFFNHLLCAFTGLEVPFQPETGPFPCQPGHLYPGIPPCHGGKEKA